jgi:hypothetical protein
MKGKFSRHKLFTIKNEMKFIFINQILMYFFKKIMKFF